MNAQQLKHCSRCGEYKPRDVFGPNPRSRDGLAYRCRPCDAAKSRVVRAKHPERIAEYNRRWAKANPEKTKNNELHYKYGITLDQYRALLDWQGGKCAGCGIAKCPTGYAFAVDHDWTCCRPPNGKSVARKGCGKCIRGLACLRCNVRDVLAGRPHVDWTAVMSTDLIKEAA